MGIFNKVGGKVLFLPGSTSTLKAKKIKENYEIILQKMGIEYITAEDFIKSAGWAALHFGLREELEELKKLNNQVFKTLGVKKIITNDPHTYYVLKQEYNIKVEHITETILKNIEVFGKRKGVVSYHDPCHLGRKSGIYNEPREILKQIGFHVVELIENKQNSFCCGQPLSWHAPKIAKGIGRLRMSEVNTDILVTTCPSCVLHLKNLRPSIEVKELSEVLLNER